MDESEQIRVLERKLAETEAARQAAAQDVAYYKHLLQGNALKSILLGELPEQARIDAFLRQYGIHFDSNCFLVALLLPDSEHYLRSTGLPQNYETLKEMGRIVEDTCEKYLPCHRTTIQMKFALIIPVKDITKNTAAQTRRIVSDCNRRMTKIMQELASEHSIPCKASISFPVKGVHWLFWAFDHAKTLIENLSEKEYICGYDVGTGGPRVKTTTAERSRFFFEQCFYTACISHDNIQACQVLGGWFRQEAQNAVYAYVGVPERIVMYCDRAILDDVIDRFGTDIQLRERDENTFTVSFTAPPRGVKFWALQYLPYVEVVEPAWLREEVIESLMQNRYLAPITED